MRLGGFAGGETAPTVSSRREAGRIHLALELPPPATLVEPVTVTFDSLTVRVDDPAQERSELRDLGGPWRFRINLKAAESLQGERTFTIDQQESSGPITVTLKGEVRLSATETLIPFVLETPPGAQTVDIMGTSRLHAGRQVLKGSHGRGQLRAVQVIDGRRQGEAVKQQRQAKGGQGEGIGGGRQMAQSFGRQARQANPAQSMNHSFSSSSIADYSGHYGSAALPATKPVAFYPDKKQKQATLTPS